MRRYLDAELERRLKDQKVVEVETAQAIVGRLSNWARLFGYFVGIPLALLFFVLGFLGFNTYSRISDLVADVEERTKTRMQEAEQQVESIRSEGSALQQEFAALRGELASLGELAGEVRSKAGEIEEVAGELLEAQEQTAAIQREGQSLLAQYEGLREQLADLGAVAQEVRALADKVERIEEKFAFETSPDLSPDLQSRVERSLADFRSYLQGLGYQPGEGEISVKVQPGLTNAYYLPGSGLVIGLAQAENVEVVAWTYASYALSAAWSARREPSPESAGSVAIALSDYFVCSFTDDPALEMSVGEGGSPQVVRDLTNERKLGDIEEGSSVVRFARAEVWGGAFWALRELLGREAADRLLFAAWAALGSEEERAEPLSDRYVAKILELARRMPEGDRSGEIRSLFAARELPV